MSEVFYLIGGAFAGMTAPFAVHPNDRARAFRYLEAAMQANIAWADAEADIRAYLTQQGCTAALIQAEVDRARPYLQPWLS